MRDDCRVYAMAAPWSRRVELLVKVGDAYGTSVVLETVPEGAAAQPTVSLTLDAAQELMDDLWRAGLRPSEGSGSAGSLRATEYHLEDMRRLVFGEKERAP